MAQISLFKWNASGSNPAWCNPFDCWARDFNCAQQNIMKNGGNLCIFFHQNPPENG
jgi:hypothetical protein